MRAWLLVAVLRLSIALAAGGILAQSGYALSWFAVGGGGSSTGEHWELNIGQQCRTCAFNLICPV